MFAISASCSVSDERCLQKQYMLHTQQQQAATRALSEVNASQEKVYMILNHESAGVGFPQHKLDQPFENADEQVASDNPTNETSFV